MRHGKQRHPAATHRSTLIPRLGMPTADQVAGVMAWLLGGGS